MKRQLIKVIALALAVLPFASGLIGLSQQQAATPDWLIRSAAEDSIIHLSVWTSDGEFSAEDVYDGMVSFEISSPAYVYLFNVSPESESGRQVHLLLPNQNSRDNFFQAGKYTFADEFEIVGPAGEAFIQAIASPLPLDIMASDEEEFRFLSRDPALFFEGIKLIFAAKGLLSAEWTGEWTSYGVRPSGVQPLAGSRCATIKIQAPELSGVSIQYSVDANCINGRPMTGQFVGPNSQDIAQVREGDRTVTLTVPGFESASLKQKVSFGSTSTFQFAGLKGTESFSIEMAPLNPNIYENVTFTPAVTTQRPVQSYVWDFGDGSAPVEGAQAVHAYHEPSQSPYRVKLTLIFGDNQSPPSMLVSRGIEVGSEPLPGACPPNTVTSSLFARSIVLESQQLSGCFSGPIPLNLIQGGSGITGRAKASVDYSWENVPAGAKLQAFLFVKYMSNGEVSAVVDRVPQIALLPATLGFFSKQIDLNIPSGAHVEMDLVLNVLENPSRGQISLEVGPIAVESVANSCTAAELLTRNENTGSSGDMISFAQGSPIKVVFKNKNCSDIDVVRDTLIIKREGSEVLNLRNSGVIVAKGSEAIWTWNQTDSNGNAISKGLYSIQVETTQGSFITRVIVVQ